MNSLYRHSIRIILEGQARSGAYIASPNFPTYRYCWLRDGSFVAHAMDCAGEHESASAFFRWVGKIIQKYFNKVERLRWRITAGLPISNDDVLHTRFSLEGEEVDEDHHWGNFQIDGYGTWLWALAEHIRLTGDRSLLAELVTPINSTLQYLELAWRLPNYDCWEEYPEYIHPYSLASVYGGITAIFPFLAEEKLLPSDMDLAAISAEIKSFIAKYGVADGIITKHIQPPCGDQPPQPVVQSGVDSSLLGLSIPFNVLPWNDPRMMATVEEIKTELWRDSGGVYRYKNDVYYGGGEWILLTAWLGLYLIRTGQLTKALHIKNWIEGKADRAGNLPEQVSDHLLTPSQFTPWLEKWGAVATPLLWSHAMYIILVRAIEETKQ